MITRRSALGAALALAALPTGTTQTSAGVAAASTTTPWRPPARYLQPRTSLLALPGGATLSLGWTGTKVSLVQHAVGLGSRFEIYDARTRDAVRAAQRRLHLPVTGVVDARTWAALHIAQPWTIDAWQPRIAVAPTASRVQRVEAAIAYALAQQGSPYTWGGSGPKALGHDCSGLVIAALTCAGLDLGAIGPARHQSPGYVTTQALYGSRMERVPLAQRRRGDLLFWFGPSGATVHTAICLDAARIVQASSSAGRTLVSRYVGSYTGHRIAPYALRPFTALPH